VRSVSIGEANVARTKARIGVVGASSISRINWASIEGAKSLIR